MIAGHRGLGDGGHPVADRAEGPGGPVVAAVGQLVLDGDAELAGETVDLGTAAVVSAGGVDDDLGAVFGDRDGGVGGQVVGQVTQAGDEGQRKSEPMISGMVRFLSVMAGSGDGGGRACGGEGASAAGPGGVVGQGGDVGVGQVGDLDPFGDAAFGDELAFAGVGRGDVGGGDPG